MRNLTLDARVKMATDMIRGNEPLEKVVKYSGLPEEKVLELYGGSRNKDNGKEFFCSYLTARGGPGLRHQV